MSRYIIFTAASVQGGLGLELTRLDTAKPGGPGLELAQLSTNPEPKTRDELDALLPAKTVKTSKEAFSARQWIKHYISEEPSLMNN